MDEQKEKEIEALISLLDDPDEKIFQQIKERLLEYGEEIIPSLESAWESVHHGLHFQARVENIIHQIQIDSVYLHLKHWREKGAQNLLDGMIILARYQYPDLNEEEIREHIEQIKRDCWLELNDNLTAYEQIRVLNHIIYDVHGYKGNKKNFHAPQNSYINTVIDNKKGNPLTLAAIYIVVAQKLGLPVQGVNLPNHFVLAYTDVNNLMQFIGQSEKEKEDGILFYINPFSRGTIFNRKEIERFLEELKVEQKDSYFRPCTNIDIVKRALTNLIYSYQQDGNEDKVDELKKLFGVL